MVDEPKFNVIVQNQEGRSPSSELDYQMMMVDGRWGDNTLSEDLRERLKTTRRVKMMKGSVIIDNDGKETIIEEDMVIPTTTLLWGELAMFTRDFRLGNLDEKDYQRALHYTLIASDCLRIGMSRAFTVALTRVAARLELSQSKDAQLRNLLLKRHSVEEHREIGENPNLVFPGKKAKR